MTGRLRFAVIAPTLHAAAMWSHEHQVPVSRAVAVTPERIRGNGLVGLVVDEVVTAVPWPADVDGDLFERRDQILARALLRAHRPVTESPLGAQS